MNERIKLLAEQATFYKEGLIEGKHDIEVFDKVKFAELIVRECAEIADTAEPFLSSDLIKQHFGVEE
jgi:hypothetical protein